MVKPLTPYEQQVLVEAVRVHGEAIEALQASLQSLWDLVRGKDEWPE